MINGREWAAIIIASFIVIAFVVAGFVQALMSAIYGVTVSFGSDWFAAMLSLSSAAVGWLMGKRPNEAQHPATSSMIDTQTVDSVNINTTAKPTQVTATVAQRPAPVATSPQRP